MKYEQLIERARAQDVGEHPGPDFMSLMNAVGEQPTPGRRWLWITSSLAAAVAAVVLLMWVSSGRSAEPVEGSHPGREQAQMRARVSSDLRDAVERRPTRRRQEVRLRAPTAAEPSSESSQLPDTPAPVETPSAEELYRRAESHMRSGRSRQARTVLRQLLRSHPTYAGRGDVVVDLARLEETMGRYERAACYYHRLATEFAAHPLAAEARKARVRLRDAHSLDLTRCPNRR